MRRTKAIKWDPVPSFIVWNRLKVLREMRGLKQGDVARDSGVSIATLWHAEQGHDERMTMKSKIRLARYFKCGVYDIFPVTMVGNITQQEFIRNAQKRG